jgi:hypothetical protein
MWRVNIYCSGDDWKRYGADFKEMTKKYQAELIVSQKMPDETRIMAYKIEGINEAESFQEDCIKFSGFTSDYESF